MRFATVIPIILAALSATAQAETCQAILDAEYSLFSGTDLCQRCDNRCTPEDGWCWRQSLDLVDYTRRNCINYGLEAGYCKDYAINDVCSN
ncbi:unnamed protein product [Periconia digitata]|uniref:Uncharacterized protein n=1 Tax=Periconia digitata TaxID=1303443 RepID=A0A9W4XGT6_9PLEO|nr:unnamed protein product [Periconia digitata]